MEPGDFLISFETALIGSMIFFFWRGGSLFFFFIFLLIGSQHKIVQNSAKPNNKYIRSNTLPEEKHANKNKEERMLIRRPNAKRPPLSSLHPKSDTP